jgi:hypothetical protein
VWKTNLAKSTKKVDAIIANNAEFVNDKSTAPKLIEIKGTIWNCSKGFEATKVVVIL